MRLLRLIEHVSLDGVIEISTGDSGGSTFPYGDWTAPYRTPEGLCKVLELYGEEFDLVGTYVFNPNFNVQLGYFRFWNGTYIQNNAPRSTADMFYVQSTIRY